MDPMSWVCVLSKSSSGVGMWQQRGPDSSLSTQYTYASPTHLLVPYIISSANAKHAMLQEILWCRSFIVYRKCTLVNIHIKFKNIYFLHYIIQRCKSYSCVEDNCLQLDFRFLLVETKTFIVQISIDQIQFGNNVLYEYQLIFSSSIWYELSLSARHISSDDGSLVNRSIRTL